MARVLQQKQQKYDSNKQLVNQTYNSLLSLDVARGMDKEYISKKSSELMQQINSMGSMDLSNSNITSRLTGSISGVAKDDRIINALSQTQKIRTLQKQMGDINKLRLEGKEVKYNEITEFHDVNRMNDYLSSQDENAMFKGSASATAWYDWKKEMNDLVDKMSLQFYSDYKEVAGSEHLLWRKRDGKILSKDTIYKSLQDNLSSSAKSAMKLESNYSFKDYSPEQIKQSIDNQYVKEFIDKDNIIDDLKAKLAVAKLDEQGILKEEIANLENYMGTLNEQRRNVVNGVDNNLENSKYSLFYDNALRSTSILRQKHDVIKNEIELNQAQVKLNEWAREDQKTAIAKQNSLLGISSFQQQSQLENLKYAEDVKNNVVERAYKNAQTAKTMAEMNSKTGLNSTLDANGNIVFDNSSSYEKYLPAIFFSEKTATKSSYGDSFNDEIDGEQKDISTLYKAEAKRRYNNVIGITTLSKNTNTGREINLADLEKNKNKFTKEEFKIITTLIDASNKAAIGQIDNLLEILEIEQINLINGKISNYKSLIKERDKVRQTAIETVITKKGLQILKEQLLKTIEYTNKFKEFQDKLLAIEIRTQAEKYKITSRNLVEEELNVFLKFNLKLALYRKNIEAFLNNDIVDLYDAEEKALIKKRQEVTNTKVILLSEEELNSNKFRVGNEGITALMSQKARGYINDDGVNVKLNQGEKAQIIGFDPTKKEALVKITNRTVNKDNLDDGREDLIGYGRVKVENSEKGVLGSTAKYFDTNLYEGYEKALNVQGYLEYQMLDKELPIKIKMQLQDPENYGSKADLYVMVGDEDWRLIKKDFLSATAGIQTMQNLIKERKAAGIKTVKDFFKDAKIK